MPKRILVADDDAGIGEMLREMLSDAGYEADIEVDGQAVRQLAKPFAMADLLSLVATYVGREGIG